MARLNPIGVEEWQAALREALNRINVDADGFSRRDIQAAYSVTEGIALKKMRNWNAQGVIEYAGTRGAGNIAGQKIRIPVYRVTEKGKR